MTPAEQVTLRDHMDALVAGLAKDIRGVHHRLDEMQATNTREHDKVVQTLNGADLRVASIETRVDLLESDRDKQAGADQHAQRVRRIVGAVSLAIVSALAGALASGLINPPS